MSHQKLLTFLKRVYTITFARIEILHISLIVKQTPTPSLYQITLYYLSVFVHRNFSKQTIITFL